MRNGADNNSVGTDPWRQDQNEQNLRKFELYSYFAVLSLLVVVVLISLNLRFPAGLLTIISAAAILMLIRKAAKIFRQTSSSLSNVETLNVNKDDVITEFSHKIREPLNNLVIITDMLMESGLQKKQKELLETFVASTSNMVNTVNELTMHSAMNLSFETRKLIKFRPAATIQNTIELYSLKEKANIDFIVNKKDASEFDCLGDPIILKQIFLAIFNTVENYETGSKKKITINLSKDKETDNEVVAGIRIQTDRQIRLIDEENPSNDFLIRLITAGRGSYAQERGTNYTVLNLSLPYRNIVSEPRKQIASPKIEELIQKEKVVKELKDINVLLVEDNLINQKITLLTLQPLVRNIDTASNGKEALDKFGMSNYDLVLMDIQMPVMSGLTAAEKIRALEASTNTHVPIIAITANAMLGDKEKCISAGIDDYISKPFQPSLLIEKIRKYI
jgi:CheY-like chemotaxis protein